LRHFNVVTTLQYNGIMNDELYIPSWQLEIAVARLEDYDKNPDQAIDFDTAMDEIEAEFDS